jgi:hypothetical protein
MVFVSRAVRNPGGSAMDVLVSFAPVGLEPPDDDFHHGVRMKRGSRCPPRGHPEGMEATTVSPDKPAGLRQGRCAVGDALDHERVVQQNDTAVLVVDIPAGRQRPVGSLAQRCWVFGVERRERYRKTRRTAWPRAVGSGPSTLTGWGPAASSGGPWPWWRWMVTARRPEQSGASNAGTRSSTCALSRQPWRGAAARPRATPGWLPRRTCADPAWARVALRVGASFDQRVRVPARTHDSVFGQFRGFMRLGCTLGGSPGIFG